MIERRSASQILFGFLPAQTIDLRGGVWRVRRWRNPVRNSDIDIATLRAAISSHASAWRAAGKDGGFVNDLHRGHELLVYELDGDNGVDVEVFPRQWMCKSCTKVHDDAASLCTCGSGGPHGQLHFVGYCDNCGTLREPFIPRCPEHGEVRIEFPGTASAADIRFVCPRCRRLLRSGFGRPNCQCGNGRLTFTVHRAASVFTPRSVVIVNPPSREQIRRVSEAGGPARALAWVANGMPGSSFDETPNTREALRRTLLQQGISPALAETLAKQAEDAGELAPAESDIEIPDSVRRDAEAQAVMIALATAEARTTVTDLENGTEPHSELGVKYRDAYPASFQMTGIQAIDLADRFPVLTGMYGYTRGDPTPGRSRLVPFRSQNQSYVVYADLVHTEALFVRLDPLHVADWLRRRGFNLADTNDQRSARTEILRIARVPAPGEDGATSDPGTELLTLVHSYAHRFLRQAAVLAGIDRNALAELLVPLHLGFFVYAAARGDFVLGGLQAVFETELDGLLREVVYGESRCVLDPGCINAGGACMACLHVGEPSCRYFNRFLDRAALFGPLGYLRPK